MFFTTLVTILSIKAENNEFANLSDIDSSTQISVAEVKSTHISRLLLVS